MKLTAKTLIFGLTFFLFNACKKDNLDLKSAVGVYEQFSWQENDCDGSSTVNSPVGPDVGKNFRFPTFNPNNSYEFIYYTYEKEFEEDEPKNQKLIKFNFFTQEELVLLEDIKVSGQPAWSKNGEIVFIEKLGSTSRIHTINDDGTNYSVPLNYGNIKLPIVNWAKDEESFYHIGQKEIEWNDKIDYLIKMNSKENTIDSIATDYPFHNHDFINENQIINFSGSGYFDLITLQDDTISTSYKLLDQGWLPQGNLISKDDGKKFYMSMINIMDNNKTGIFEIDYEQNTYKTIYKGCEKAFSTFYSVDNANNYVLIERKDVSGSNMPSEIWLYDIKNNKETVLFADE